MSKEKTDTRAISLFSPLPLSLLSLSPPLSLSRLRKEYESIAEKALTTPSSTEHLMELKEYIQTVKTKEMIVLEDRIIQARQRIQFLVSHPSLSLSPSFSVFVLSLYFGESSLFLCLSLSLYVPIGITLHSFKV